MLKVAVLMVGSVFGGEYEVQQPAQNAAQKRPAQKAPVAQKGKGRRAPRARRARLRRRCR